MSPYDTEAEDRARANNSQPSTTPVAWNGVLGGQRVTIYGDTPLTDEEALARLRPGVDFRNTGKKEGGLTRALDTPEFWQAVNPNATQAERDAQARAYSARQRENANQGNFAPDKPWGTMAAMLAAAAGGAALVGMGGGAAAAGSGAAAGGSGAATGAATGAGAGVGAGGIGAGFGTNAGGLGIFANGGAAGMAGVGAGNAGALAASGAIGGGAGVAGGGLLGRIAGYGGTIGNQTGVSLRSQLQPDMTGGGSPMAAPQMPRIAGLFGQAPAPELQKPILPGMPDGPIQGFGRKPYQFYGQTIWM